MAGEIPSKKVISIHSPHTGRDVAGRGLQAAPLFQSTLPTRGETIASDIACTC